MLAKVIGPIPKITHLHPQQLPVAPISPPLPGAEALGSMTWDLPDYIVYTPYGKITANIELLNPTSEEKLYGLGYYFINPQGVIAAEDYVYFLANSWEFSAFLLPPEGKIPMTTTLSFQAPGVGYRFGLRMLLLEMDDTEANVIQETNRLEVSLVSAQQESPLPYMMMLMVPIAVVATLSLRGT